MDEKKLKELREFMIDVHRVAKHRVIDLIKKDDKCAKIQMNLFGKLLPDDTEIVIDFDPELLDPEDLAVTCDIYIDGWKKYEKFYILLNDIAQN